MVDWHPIETIPAGRLVLVWSAQYNETAIVWAKRWNKGMRYFPAGGAIGWKPTHWAELPKGPKEWHAKHDLEAAHGLRH